MEEAGKRGEGDLEKEKKEGGRKEGRKKRKGGKGRGEREGEGEEEGEKEVEEERRGRTGRNRRKSSPPLCVYQSSFIHSFSLVIMCLLMVCVVSSPSFSFSPSLILSLYPLQIIIIISCM